MARIVEITSVVTAGSFGVDTFRIPAVVRLARGDLLAFMEARRDGAGDAGVIAVRVCRSTDGGRTWSDPVKVRDDPRSTCGNPVPVVTADDGIVLLTTSNPAEVGEAALMSGEAGGDQGRRVCVQRGTAGGLEWQEPVDVTDQVKLPTWGWYATGPGHGIRLVGPTAPGRLVVPANHSLLPLAGEEVTAALYAGHGLVSDDDGRTWRIGWLAEPEPGADPNESTAAELPDGRVYVNARNEAREGSVASRLGGWSADGGLTLEAPMVPHPDLAGPRVEGSVLQPAAEGAPLLYCGPSAARTRARLAVRRSDDHGRTWTEALLVDAGPAAYCDLVDLGWPSVGVLYEGGHHGPYEQMLFARLDLSDE